MKTNFKKLLIILLTFAMLAVLFSCNKGNSDQSSDVSDIKEGNVKEINYDTKNPVVEIHIKDYGVVTAELYPDIAPNTVNNFISLIKSGFYDNNTMHRLIPGFVLQGGDPTGTGYGDPGYSIKGEFTVNGFQNDLKHTLGVLSMARAEDPDSAGSQFFIMLGTADWLDGKYAAFGKVVKGLEVVQKIESTEKVIPNSNGKLVKPLTITKVYVDTKGVDYPDPIKVK